MISVYFSLTPNYQLGYACVTGVTPVTSRRAWYITCNATILEAEYVTIVRNTTTSSKSLAVSEVQPLRYGECPRCCNNCGATPDCIHAGGCHSVLASMQLHAHCLW